MKLPWSGFRRIIPKRIWQQIFLVLVFLVMLPLVILGSGIGKLSGFALTTIAGVLFGVLISRPAFQEIIKVILIPQEKKDEAAKQAAQN